MVILIKLFQVPIVYHLHGKGATKHYNNDKKLYDYVYKDANIICLSKILIHDISFANGPIHIVPNGIDKRFMSLNRIMKGQIYCICQILLRKKEYFSY